MESLKLFQRAKDAYEKMQEQGTFILVASRRIAKTKILPSYYMLKQIKQIFDIGKLIQDKLLKTTINPIPLFLNLRNQKYKVYSRAVITQEEFKKVNDCYKLFKINCPVRIPLK
jgi:hypothetical protein